MPRLSHSDWIQLIGGLAIVAGLLLVLFELQQARAITGAELTNSVFDAELARYNTLMGEHPAAILEKACLAPEDLTQEERFVTAMYFNSVFLVTRRMWVLSVRGDFGETSRHWRSWADGAFTRIFNYPDGKHWWAEMRELLPYMPDVVELGDQKLLELGDGLYCRDFYRNWESLAPASITQENNEQVEPLTP